MDSESIERNIQRAADLIATADALLIGAGAGMGVDSGLPDFRGSEGFWKAYPPFRGRDFSEISNPIWFARDPQQAWGFFGHRYQLYRETTPHAGFDLLRGWCSRMQFGHFVFTSNVDGHFQKSGFDDQRVVECHGSINFMQCTQCYVIWPAEDLQFDVDMTTIRAAPPLPTCKECGMVVRPNILMFGDWSWIPERTDQQEGRFAKWIRDIRRKRLVVIELGAGLAIPTVRYHCESADGKLIRINPRDPQAKGDAISLPLPALDALKRIDEAMPG